MKEQHGLGQRLSSCDQPVSSSLHRRGFLMAGLAGAGVLAGCGGGGDAGGSIPSPVNTAEDARQTNQVGATATAPTSVRFEAKGRQILRNGEPYYAKGMCYSPQPIGAHFKDEPWGDFFSDFWQPLFSRDLPLLKAMGVNSIRLYSTLPFRLIYDANSARLSHKLFLDACQDAGISVWVGFPIDGGVFPAQDKAQLERIRIGTQLLAEQVGQHPAVIGFTISNEANIDGRKEDPSFWSWINELAGIAKAKAPDKLTMISLFDDTGMRSINYAETRTPNLDVFGINAYRGTVNTGMGTLFTEYQDASTRPLLITEFGCSASTRSTPKQGPAIELPNRAAAQGEYLRTQWLDIARPQNRAINSGGYAFAWSDEWWKHGDLPQEQNNGQAENGNYPGGYADEEWYGIHSIALNPQRAGQPGAVVLNGVHYPDVLTPRAAADVLKALWTAPA